MGCFFALSCSAGSNGDAPRGTAGVSVAGPEVGPRAVFAGTRGLLFVLLPREVLALDTELGVPAGGHRVPGLCLCVCVYVCVCVSV